MLTTIIKKGISKLALIIAFLLAVSGFSALAITQANAATWDPYQYEGDGRAHSGVTIVTIVCQDGTPESDREPQSISYFYSPKFHETKFGPINGEGSGPFRVYVNPDAKLLGTNAPDVRQMKIDITYPNGDIRTVDLDLDYNDRNFKNMYYPTKVNNRTVSVGEGDLIPTGDFLYNKETGVMDITGTYWDKELTIYQYVSAEQASASDKIPVYARQSINGIGKYVPLKEQIDENSTSPYPEANLYWDDVKNVFDYQGTAAKEYNVAFSEMPENNGDGGYLGYDLDSIDVWGTVLGCDRGTYPIDAPYANDVTFDYWKLTKDSDYWITEDGTLTFARNLKAGAILITSNISTHDSLTEPITPTLVQRTSSSLTFEKADGYSYRLLDDYGDVVGGNGSEYDWNTHSASHVVKYNNLTRGEQYTIQYRDDTNKTITSRTFVVSDFVQNSSNDYSSQITDVYENYVSPFNVGDMFTAELYPIDHMDESTDSGNTLYRWNTLSSHRYAVEFNSFTNVENPDELNRVHGQNFVPVYNTTVAYNDTTATDHEGQAKIEVNIDADRKGSATAEAATFLNYKMDLTNGRAREWFNGYNPGRMWADYSDSHIRYRYIYTTNTTDTIKYFAPRPLSDNVRIICTRVDKMKGLAYFYAYTIGDRTQQLDPVNLHSTTNIAGYFTVQLDKPMHVELNKASYNSGITDTWNEDSTNNLNGNSAYSVQYAEYSLYDKNKNDRDLLTTEAEGFSCSIDFPYGSYTRSTQRTDTYYDWNRVNGDLAQIQVVGFKISPTPDNLDIKEKTPSKGYIIDPETYTTQALPGNIGYIGEKVLTNDDNPFFYRDENLDCQKYYIYENPMSKYWSFKHVDKQTNSKYAPGAATLEGALFSVKYYAIDPDKAKPLNAEVEREWILKSDADGEVMLDNDHFVSGDQFYYNTNHKIVWPLGWYDVQEIQPSEGYHNTEGDIVYSFKFSVSDNSMHRNIGPFQYVIRDVDPENDNYMPNVEYSQGKIGVNGDVINGIYVDDKYDKEQTVIEKDNIRKYMDQVIRGDLSFTKTYYGENPDVSGLMPGVPFILTNLDSGEQHIVTTDINGKLTTEYDSISRTGVRHSTNTNYNDTVFDLDNDKHFSETEIEQASEKFDTSVDTDRDGHFSTEELENAIKNNVVFNYSNNGTWFSAYGHVNYGADKGYEEGFDNQLADIVDNQDEYNVGGIVMHHKDELRALPYGRYELTEVPCAANFGRELLFRTFNVDKEGNIDFDESEENKMVDHVIGFETNATDDRTGAHEGDATTYSSVSITDKVTLTNLSPYRVYSLIAELHVRTYDADGNPVDSQPIYAIDPMTGATMYDAFGNPVPMAWSHVFTPTTANTNETVQITDIPAELVAGKDIVVYEKLYQGNIFRANHEQIEDEMQLITFPDLHAYTVDKVTNTQEGAIAAGVATLKSYIQYDNLVIDREYSITATLMDADTGSIIVDNNGNPVTYRTTFTPTEETGRSGVHEFEIELPREYIGERNVTMFVDLNSFLGHVGGSKRLNKYELTVDYTKIPVLADGTYIITSRLSNARALDVLRASTLNKANVQIYENNDTAAQRWNVTYDNKTKTYTIVCEVSGKALDVRDGKMTKGQNVWQYSTNGTSAQRWKITRNDDGTFKIASGKDNKYVLDISNGSTKNCTNVQLWTENDGYGQRWNFTPAKSLSIIGKTVPEGTYTIASKLDSKKVVDVKDASTKNKANIQLYTKNNTKAQQFEFVYDNEGYYTIINVKSKKALDVYAAQQKDGTNVWQYDQNNTDAQKWRVLENSDGSYTLKNKATGKMLDLQSAKTKNGTNIQIWGGNDTNAQKWTLTRI